MTCLVDHIRRQRRDTDTPTRATWTNLWTGQQDSEAPLRCYDRQHHHDNDSRYHSRSDDLTTFIFDFATAIGLDEFWSDQQDSRPTANEPGHGDTRQHHDTRQRHSISDACPSTLDLRPSNPARDTSTIDTGTISKSMGNNWRVPGDGLDGRGAQWC